MDVTAERAERVKYARELDCIRLGRAGWLLLDRPGVGWCMWQSGNAKIHLVYEEMARRLTTDGVFAFDREVRVGREMCRAYELMQGDGDREDRRNRQMQYFDAGRTAHEQLDNALGRLEKLERRSHRIDGVIGLVESLEKRTRQVLHLGLELDKLRRRYDSLEQRLAIVEAGTPLA